MITVLSLDPEINADIVAMLGASAAVQMSGIPFDGPMGACRVGYVDGQYVLNPAASVVANESSLDLVVAGTENAVLMVESQADILSEEVMLGAVMFGHDNVVNACQAISEFAERTGRTMWDWQPAAADESIAEQVKSAVYEQIQSAYLIAEKTARNDSLKQIREQIINQIAGVDEDQDQDKASEVYAAVSSLEKQAVRSRILAGEARIDGRDTKTVRPIEIELGVLPRTHGSALFTTWGDPGTCGCDTWY